MVVLIPDVERATATGGRVIPAGVERSVNGLADRIPCAIKEDRMGCIDALESMMKGYTSREHLREHGVVMPPNLFMHSVQQTLA